MSVPENRPKRPWGGFGYVILIVIAILAAYFLVLPIGQQVASVFQRLTNAFQTGK